MLSNFLNLNCLYEKASIFRGGDKMIMRHKVKQTLLICKLLAIAFAAFNCEDESMVNGNGNTGDEITWQQTALDSLRIFPLGADSSGNVFAGAACGGIYRTTDHGTTWASVYPTGCPRSIATRADGEIFAILAQISVLHSSDSGESWITTFVTGFGANLGPIAFNASGEIFVGSGPSDETRGGIYRSSDNGDTWIQTSLPDSIDGRALAINANGDIFVGTGFGIFRSTDNGETWVQINNGFESSGFVFPIAISPVNQYIFAAVEGDGVYRSTDNGDTWVHTGLRSPAIVSVAINSNGDIFAGSGSSRIEPEGVFYSKDNGNSWIQINSGLTSTNVFSLTVDSSGFVYAGTGGDGVFRTVKSTT